MRSRTNPASFPNERNDVAQAVVAVVAAAALQPHHAGLECHLVVHDQNLRRREFVERRDGADRLAAQDS